MRSFELPTIATSEEPILVEESEVLPEDSEPIVEEPEVIETPDSVMTTTEIVSNAPRSNSKSTKTLSALVGGIGSTILSAFTGA
jgi:hypothetical protein